MRISGADRKYNAHVWILALTVASLVSCAPSPGTPPANSPVASPSEAVVPVESVTPTPTQTPLTGPEAAGTRGPSGTFVAHMKDVDGYTFDLDVNVITSSLGETVADDKPGFMSARFLLDMDLHIINTTPGRNVSFKGVDGVTKPFGNPKFLVSALWNSDSPICLSAAESAKRATKPCSILLGFGYADVSTPAGGTTALKVFKGSPGGHQTAGMAGFPETEWPAIKEALTKPDAFLVSYDGGDFRRFGCPLHGFLGAIVGADSPAYERGAVMPELVKHPAT